MDSRLCELIDADTPKLNPVLAEGLAVRDMKYVEAYINDVFKSAARGFPPGLTYVGYTRCTPQEEFEQLTKIKNNKRQFDVARSDLYMVKFHFKYKGEDLEPRYMSLPYVSDAGTIVLGGSRFNISPVLSDRVISVGVSSIFVRLLKARLTYERMLHHYMADDRRETVQVVWSSIYNKNAKMKKLKPTVRANCSMVHYLLCKYGFKDTFLKYGNCAPVVGGAEINESVYPREEWVICSSTQTKPSRGVGKGYWEPPAVRIAVRRSEYTPMVRNMLGGFFYVADHFPARVLPEYVESKRMWMILMGHIIFSGSIGDGKLCDDIGDHLKFLDEYIDNLFLDKLKQVGLEIENIYDLFAVIVERFNDWIVGAGDNIASMYDKELSVLYFVLFDIITAINNLYFKLRSASMKQELTRKEIEATMKMTLRTGLVYSITKNHGEVSTISSPGDNKAFKVTSLLVPQSGSNRQGSRKDRAVLNDPAKRLHISVAEIGGYLNLPKSQPDGRARLNQMTDIDERGVVQRKVKFMDLTTGVQEMIKR